MKGICSSLAGLGAALLLSGCSVSDMPKPSLTGPSEFALSVDVTASPDTLTQDGQAQSTIAVVAKGPNGEPRSNVTFRLDLQVDGEPSDYGLLNTRSITTGSDGRATAVYRAPAPPPVGATSIGGCSASWSALAGPCVRVVATPVSSGFDAVNSQSVLIHLVPSSVIIVVPPSATPVPAFTIAPQSVAANAVTNFDATASCPGQLVGGACPASAGTIVSYAWNFGDGSTATGKIVSHTYTRQQTYQVSLTITNDRGQSATTTRAVDVGVGALPTATFTSSPTDPVPNQPVHFDATPSRAGAGHSLVRYVWNYGDGSERQDSNSPIVSHAYVAEGTYVVTLNIVDEVGQVATATRTVTVKIPSAE